MAAFTAIELGQNPPAIPFIGDETQQMEGFGNSAEVRNGPGKRRRPFGSCTRIVRVIQMDLSQTLFVS
jgi:hypothetical protein